MLVVSSKNCTPLGPDPTVAKVLGEVSSDRLRAFVRMLAFPRHYFAENRANPASKDISGSIRTATEATQKDHRCLKDIPGPEACAEWTWIGVQSNSSVKRILFARQ